MKFRLSILLMLAMAFMAHGQSGTFITPIATWGVPYDGWLPLLGQGPQAGFTAYATPIPPKFIYHNLTKEWQWISTCPQGGNLVQTVVWPNSSQINVSSGLYNPTNGNAQGRFSGFASVSAGIPSFTPTTDPRFPNGGGPCGPM